VSGQIGTLTARIEELLAAIPAAQGVDADGTTGPGAGSSLDGGGAARRGAAGCRRRSWRWRNHGWRRPVFEMIEGYLLLSGLVRLHPL
jgi:hypothetical protein